MLNYVVALLLEFKRFYAIVVRHGMHLWHIDAQTRASSKFYNWLELFRVNLLFIYRRIVAQTNHDLYDFNRSIAIFRVKCFSACFFIDREKFRLTDKKRDGFVCKQSQPFAEGPNEKRPHRMAMILTDFNAMSEFYHFWVID